MVQALDPDHRLCQAIVPGLGPASDPDHQLFQPLVPGLDWQQVLELERGSPIGPETRFQGSEVVTRDHGFPIRALEFRIAWQIARKHSKTDEAT